jgi:hypothetical protein
MMPRAILKTPDLLELNATSVIDDGGEAKTSERSKPARIGHPGMRVRMASSAISLSIDGAESKRWGWLGPATRLDRTGERMGSSACRTEPVASVAERV